MWVKKFINGTIITENRAEQKTWLKTSLDNLAEVTLIADPNNSESLSGYLAYWHSRGVVVNPQSGKSQIVCERIQGLKPDQTWDTVEWRGIQFVKYNFHKAIGKPILNG